MRRALGRCVSKDQLPEPRVVCIIRRLPLIINAVKPFRIVLRPRSSTPRVFYRHKVRDGCTIKALGKQLTVSYFDDACIRHRCLLRCQKCNLTVVTGDLMGREVDGLIIDQSSSLTTIPNYVPVALVCFPELLALVQDFRRQLGNYLKDLQVVKNLFRS
jgi:hypothetical protein